MDTKEKLLEIMGAGRFKQWFGDAAFTNDSISVSSAFKRDYVVAKFTSALVSAFGKMPEIAIQKKTSAAAPLPAPVKSSAEIVPIEKARRPKTGFSAREMILLNLPHSDPKAPVWMRENGKLTLTIQGGYRKNVQTGKPEYIGIPYGATARLLLFYLMSEATLTKSPRIYLGNSFAAFLEVIGAAKDGGGKKSGRVSVLRQLERLMCASLSVSYFNDNTETSFFAGENAHFVKRFELWFSKKEPEQGGLWESYIDLSIEIFESLKKAAVPLDWDILLQLRKSPLALDLYAWLTYESARAQMTGKNRFVPWAALKEQVGAEYDRLDNFVTAAKRELGKIKKIYKGLSLGNRRAGIEIKADSLPSVERHRLPAT